ncbi:WSC domain-containing protein, partial [Lacticaseibacillus paracasei]
MFTEYKGCFVDKEDRDISGGHYIDSTGNCVEKCAKFCFKRNFKYAGLQAGQECFCGNSYGKHRRSDACGWRCTGNA